MWSAPAGTRLLACGQVRMAGLRCTPAVALMIGHYTHFIEYVLLHDCPPNHLPICVHHAAHNAGNNEIEGSLGWYAESRTNKQLFATDYVTLFIDTIRPVIMRVCI
jgi:hypothetical protein